MEEDLVLALRGRLTPADIPWICERARALFALNDSHSIVCDVGDLVAPDVAAVDALARLQLVARRIGCEVRFRHACDELVALLALTGLRGVLPLETRGQPEQREQTLGVEEERDAGDLTLRDLENLE